MNTNKSKFWAFIIVATASWMPDIARPDDDGCLTAKQGRDDYYQEIMKAVALDPNWGCPQGWINGKLVQYSCSYSKRDWKEDAGFNFDIWRSAAGPHEPALMARQGCPDLSSVNSSTPPTECPTRKAGSIVNVDEMSLGEQVPITGTPFALTYSSDRVPGNLNNYRLHIALDGFATASSKEIVIRYLGRTLKFKTTAAAYNFVWDGRNAAGQEVPGPIMAGVMITPFYVCHLGPGCTEEAGYTVGSSHAVGSFDARRYGLGGWSLSSLHYLHLASVTYADLAPPAYKLYLGDGSVRTVMPQPLSTTTGEAWQVIDHDVGVIYTFNAQGRHLFTRNELTNAPLLRFNYTASGKLASVVDSFGNTTRVVRDAGGAVTGIRSPYGQLTSIARNANGWISRIGNPAGEHHDMTYVDAKGVLKTFRRPGGQIATFSYDARGRLLKDSNSAGNSLTLALTEESETHRSIKTTTAAGRVATINNVVDPYGSYSYRRNQMIPLFQSTATDEAGNTFSQQYQPTIRSAFQDNDLNYWETYLPDLRFKKNNPTVSDAAFHVDQINMTQGANILQASFQYTVDNTSSTPTPFNYNALTTTATINDKTFASVYTRATGETVFTSAKGRVQSTITDKYGRVTQAKFAALTPAQFSYDARGRLTGIQQGERSIALSYDAKGWLHEMSDVLNQKYTYTHDPAGRVTSVTLPDARAIFFSYDANGNLTEVTPPGRPAHVLAHNAFDLLGAYTPPAVAEIANVATRYSYNNDRQLTTINRPDGQSIKLNYQPGSARLASITTPSGNYAYDFDTSGRPTSTIAPTGLQSEFAWSGRLFAGENVHSNTGASRGAINLTYNDDFQPSGISVTDATGAANDVGFFYDLDGLLTKAGGLTLTRAASTGFLTKTVLGNVTETYDYDAAYGELTAHAASISGASPVFSETLTRDAIGRLASKTETVQGTSTGYDYTYDSAGRLTDVRRNGAAYSHYDYDQNSNRIGGKQGGVSVSAQYDDQDRLLSYGGKTYRHTANGELQSVTKIRGGAVTAFSYDVFGNLKQVLLPDGSKVGYNVDGLNRRISRSVNGVVQKRYLYQSQLQIAAELSPAGKLLTRFIYGSKSHVPDYMVRGGVRYKFITDHLGSVRLVINVSTGVVAQQLGYDEFGRVLKDTSPGFQPFGYAGGLYDPDTKLVHFGARDYDAETGRWLSKDPILFGGGDSNLYGYAENSALNKIDPTGLDSVVVGGGLSGTVGVGGEISCGYLINDDGRVGVFGSAGAASGFNLSAQVFAGYFTGNNLEGNSINGNYGMGLISLTTFHNPNTGEFGGAVVGIGPSLGPPLSHSTSVSKTGTVTYNLIENIVMPLYNWAYGFASQGP